MLKTGWGRVNRIGWRRRPVTAACGTARSAAIRVSGSKQSPRKSALSAISMGTKAR
jgi:hypothetical protein